MKRVLRAQGVGDVGWRAAPSWCADDVVWAPCAYGSRVVVVAGPSH